MSQFMTVEIPIGTKDEIKDVLEHLNLEFEEAEEGGKIDMVGYGGAVGRRSADIVVRKEQFGGYSDIGFRDNGNGEFELITDSDDGIVTTIKNVHLYKKVESAAQRKRRKMKIVEGEVPTSLRARQRNQGKIVISIPG